MVDYRELICALGDAFGRTFSPQSNSDVYQVINTCLYDAYGDRPTLIVSYGSAAASAVVLAW